MGRGESRTRTVLPLRVVPETVPFELSSPDGLLRITPQADGQLLLEYQGAREGRFTLRLAPAVLAQICRDELLAEGQANFVLRIVRAQGERILDYLAGLES